MAKPVADRREPVDLLVDGLGLGAEASAQPAAGVVGVEQLLDFAQGELGLLGGHDDGEAFEDLRFEASTQTAATGGADEAPPLVEAQRRRGETTCPGDLAAVSY